MSTIEIRFQTQALDGGQSNRGTVTVVYNNGSQNLNLPLRLSQSVSTSGNFTEVPWVNGSSGEDNRQALNFAQSFNRDYKNIGGVKNMAATVVSDTVTITATDGTFPENQSSYNGNVLIVTGFTVDNSPQTTPLNLSVLRTSTGNCNTIQHSATATGGTPPYTLYNSNFELQDNWNGSSFDFNLNRNVGIATIRVVDTNAQERLISIVIPRNLAAGEFNVTQTQFEASSDLVVENLNPILGTTPLEYSLDELNASNGTVYQTSNAFAGVLPGTYQLFVRDVYGCEVKKVITVSTFQDATQDVLDYFDINKINSIIFAPSESFNSSLKKNFDNTLSINSLDGINYELRQSFNEEDVVPIQFKSSYPYHVVTLHRCDGTKHNIPSILIQENLGFKEKVDINLLTVGNQTGFYFDGGNQYEPDTEDIIGQSEYTSFSPDWATEGQLVSIDGLGSFRIVGTGYDDALAKTYFLIDLQTAQTTAKVQVTFNVQPYNLFEFYVPINQIYSSGRLVVEYGTSFNKIMGRWYSELLIKDNDNDNLLIEVGSTKNKADFVFTENTVIKNRISGVFRPFFEGEVENFNGDSRLYPLNESFYQRYKLELDLLTARQVYQFGIWCLLDGFKVNNLPLRATTFPEIEQLGDSNYFSFKVNLGFTGNLLATQPDEVVLDTSTGTELPNQSIDFPIAHDGRTRLIINGGFVTVGGNYVSI